MEQDENQVQLILMEAAMSNETPADLESMLNGLSIESDDLSWLLAACQSNNIDLVREVVRTRPDLLWWRNPEGEGVIHIGCEQENDILQLLLETNPGLCYQKDKGGEFPLLDATRRGKVRVIEAIVKACPDSLVEQLTLAKESALHLAVKHDNVGAFRLLMNMALAYNPDILHSEDVNGNNVLHIAASRKQFQILRWLLVDNDTGGPLVPQDSRNGDGCTAREIHSHNHTDQNDRSITLLLCQGDYSKPSHQSQATSSNMHRHKAPPALTLFSFSIKSTLLLTLSALVAGSTYTSIFNLSQSPYGTTTGALMNVAVNEVIFFHLPSAFFNILFMTVAFTVSLIGVVVSLWWVTKGWSLCFVAIPSLGLVAFFLSFAVIMKDKVPKFWVGNESFKISSCWLVWLCSQALIILILVLLWIGEKIVTNLSLSPKPNRP